MGELSTSPPLMPFWPQISTYPTLFPGACWVKPVQGYIPKHHRFTIPSGQLIPQPPFTKQNNAIDKFKRTPRSHRKI
ncbi:hypothetical protein I7I48_03044 [Histoplasma ohiense]|nr:hypothetical protein I7I48_03044 [Histoplasma ohiense (nom. inval.)]